MLTPLLQQAAASASAPSYAAELLRMLLALLFVSALAFFSLRLLARRFPLHGLPPGRDGRVQVLSRVALAPRKSLYLVRVDGRVLLLGSGESGPPSLLVELAPERAPVEPVPTSEPESAPPAGAAPAAGGSTPSSPPSVPASASREPRDG